MEGGLRGGGGGRGVALLLVHSGEGLNPLAL